MNISGLVSEGVNREYVSPEVKAEYLRLMQLIQTIMNKGSYSSQDVEELQKAMRGLDELQKKGFEADMTNSKNALFMFFKAAGIDAYSHIAIDPAALIALKGLSIDLKDGKKLTFLDVLKTASDENSFTNVTDKLGDMLLDFADWGFREYGEQVKKLEEQINISIQAIRNIQALQQLLNQIGVQYPSDYKLPPENWNQIPKEIQDKILKQWGGTDNIPKEGPIPDFHWASIRTKIDNNLDQFIKWSDEYFTEELGVEPKLQFDSIARMLKIRDDLIKQRDALIAGGDDMNKEGTPANTLNRVIQDLLGKFPDKTPNEPGGPIYPIGSNWDALYGVKDADGKIVSYNFPPSANKAAEDWIRGGQDRGTINDNLDSALTANQTLSNEMSDKLKTKNVFLQTLYDILSQISRGLDKAVQGAAQKINR